MEENMKDMLMMFGISLALFSIFSTAEKSGVLWWLTAIAGLFFVCMTLLEVWNLYR